jgi:transcription antitermination factor NusG
MPDRLPADVLQSPPRAPEAWWVLRTRPRQEKKLARWLGKAHLAYFVPLRRRVRNWRGRRIRSEEPLLAGYVFLCGAEAAATRAYASGAVAEKLRVENSGGLYSELRALETLCALEREMRELPGLVEGREVEFKAGPLQGLRGVISQNGAAFVVRLEILGRILEIALDPAEVEPL